MEQVKDSQKTDTRSDNLANNGLDPKYVVLKIEKLTSALHLVTSFLHNSDPIKYKLRDLGLSVMHRSFGLKNSNGQYQTVLLDDLKKGIDDLASFISVAMTDSGVSQMNLTILQKEYRDLYQYLDRHQINQESLVGKINPPVNQALHSGQPALRPLNTSINRAHLAVPVDNRNNERRNQVISFITTNGWSAINDIAKAVPGVSGKTIQRELVSLVNEGILLKKGDRRWSRYQLANKG